MKFKYYGIVLLSLAISACSSTPTLKQWTDQELAPYLVKELGEHPRFKQQPLILVDMQGERVEAEIDQLTLAIREQVFNTLLQSKGVNLNWQASATALQHHTRLQDLQCQPKQSNRFYIGFDLKPVNEHFQLSIKALDPEQGRWISGFGKTWQGDLSKQEQQQLQQTQTDEILRGLRPLPFTEQQIDLLANYLAKNISCLMQQSKLDELSIYPEKGGQQAIFLQKTLDLVVNYLSRFNEVRIVNHVNDANIILKAQVHPINGNLHQIWLITQDKLGKERLQGVDTTAYVKLSAAALRIPVAPIEQPAPLVVIVPEQPVPVIEKPRLSHGSAKLFNHLNLISPIGESFCQTTNPWVMGEYALKKNRAIAYCFGLSMSTNQDTEVFLINENQHGEYYRLLPDHGETRFELFAGEQLRYPESHLFDLAANVSAESLHVLAVSTPFVANKLHQLLRRMPVCCESSTNRSNWATKLQTFAYQYAEYIDWQVLEVKH